MNEIIISITAIIVFSGLVTIRLRKSKNSNNKVEVPYLTTPPQKRNVVVSQMPTQQTLKPYIKTPQQEIEEFPELRKYSMLSKQPKTTLENETLLENIEKMETTAFPNFKKKGMLNFKNHDDELDEELIKDMNFKRLKNKYNI